MRKLEDKVAVITRATSGMALATAKLFLKEGAAYTFITGRRQEKLDEAVKAIGRNETGVQGDVANLADLERSFNKRSTPEFERLVRFETRSWITYLKFHNYVLLAKLSRCRTNLNNCSSKSFACSRVNSGVCGER